MRIVISRSDESKIETKKASEEKKRENSSQIHVNQPDEEIADLLETMGASCHSSGEYRASLQYYEQALARRKQIYSDKPQVEIVSLLISLGNQHNRLGDFPTARNYYDQAITVGQQISEKPHALILTSLRRLGLMCIDLGDYTAARDYCAQALVISKQVYGQNPHSEIVKIRLTLGNLRPYAKHRNTIARLYFQRAQLAYQQLPMPIYSSALGYLDRAIALHEDESWIETRNAWEQEQSQWLIRKIISN